MLLRHITAPINLTVLYAVIDELHARLRIASHNEAAMRLEIRHQAQIGHECFIAGNQTSESFYVRYGETLTVIARRDNVIVASGVYEIDSLSAAFGTILVMQCASKISMDQQEEGREPHTVESQLQVRTSVPTTPQPQYSVEDQALSVLEDLEAKGWTL